MTAIEVVALIGAVIVPIKLVTIIWKGQNAWFETVTKRYWNNAVVTTLLSLLAAVVLLYILLKELTIVQIWAAAMFGMALTSLALAPFSKYMLKVEKRWFTETNVLRTGWVAVIVWVAMIAWVIYALFR